MEGGEMSPVLSDLRQGARRADCAQGRWLARMELTGCSSHKAIRSCHPTPFTELLASASSVIPARHLIWHHRLKRLKLKVQT